MSYINVNLDEVSEGGKGKLHECGPALLTIKDVTVKESKANNAYANFQIHVEEVGGVAVTDNNTPLWETCTFTPKAIFNLYNLGVAIGFIPNGTPLKEWAAEVFEMLSDCSSFQEVEAVATPWLKENFVGQQFRDTIKLTSYTNKSGEQEMKNELSGKFQSA